MNISLIKDTCNSNPCLNNSTCIFDTKTNNYTCNCSSLFDGLNCQIPLNGLYKNKVNSLNKKTF